MLIVPDESTPCNDGPKAKTFDLSYVIHMDVDDTGIRSAVRADLQMIETHQQELTDSIQTAIAAAITPIASALQKLTDILNAERAQQQMIIHVHEQEFAYSGYHRMPVEVIRTDGPTVRFLLRADLDTVMSAVSDWLRAWNWVIAPGVVICTRGFETVRFRKYGVWTEGLFETTNLDERVFFWPFIHAMVLEAAAWWLNAAKESDQASPLLLPAPDAYPQRPAPDAPPVVWFAYKQAMGRRFSHKELAKALGWSEGHTRNTYSAWVAEQERSDKI